MSRHLREAFTSLFRNKLMTIITLISIMITLTIVGVFSVLLMNINSITKSLDENVESVVYIDVEATPEQINMLEEKILNLDRVDKVEFISKDDGLDNLINSLGEDGEAFESLKTDNPLNDTFIVSMKDPQDTKDVSLEIAEYGLVDKVDYGEGIIQVLFSITDSVRKGGFILIIGLFITASLLIANTIKMTIEMRKEEVKIMKLVGSRNMYIRLPFIIEGILISFIGSIIPLIIITIGYTNIYDSFGSSLVVNIVELLPLKDVIFTISLLLIGLSMIIGVLGSVVSIRRYLKV